MIIEKLKWDTLFFGIKIGKLVLQGTEDFNPIRFREEAVDEKYELVYIFKFQTMLAREILKAADLELMDIMLTMSKKIIKEDYLNLPYEFKTELSEKELGDCYSIAEETSVVSRFYNEPKIGACKTKKLYRKWIDNTLNKSFSDGLFLVKANDSVIGMHLIKTDEKNKIGYFTLTGVDPSFKRMGIGKKLWYQSFSYWINEFEINIIKSPFSMQNAESFNFHLKMGFNRIEEIKYIYHFRNMA